MRCLRPLAATALVLLSFGAGAQEEEEFALPFPAASLEEPPAPASTTARPAASPHEASPVDEDWEPFPFAPALPADLHGAPAHYPTPPPPPPPAYSRPVVRRHQPRPPRPEDFNEVSLFGAPALGRWKRGLGLHLGFPLVGARVGIGLADRLDVGLGLDSFYGAMNEFRAFARWQLFGGPSWAGAVALEGGRALFSQRACAESRGPRWLTGRRDYNLLPGFILSYRGATPRSARLFLDVRYHLAFDTDPCARVPLSGVPASFAVGHNVPVRAGAEMPFSPKTSFLFLLGFDIHGRAEDSAFMPACSVGMVTAF